LFVWGGGEKKKKQNAYLSIEGATEDFQLVFDEVPIRR